LTIDDDGCGFDVATALGARKGLGLISMGERAELLGGDLNVRSTPGAGTVVEVGLF
jgi:signal transduction histidine kinase